MTPSNPEQSNADMEIETAVLSYLDRHPNAADTLEGIANWWLPQQRYITAQVRIHAVLQELVSRGVLQLRRLPDGAALYTRAVE